jgi:hypothetical protein
MGSNYFHLICAKGTGFVEDAIGDLELADVVEESGQTEIAKLGASHAGALAGADGQFSNADHMIPTYRVFAVKQSDEAMGHGRKAEVECD